MPPKRKTSPPPVQAWEGMVLESIGRVIVYWGFKRNHGRIWALLYLRDEPMDAATLGRRLQLSKGAVSIVARELEDWSVIRRVSANTRSGIAFVAERNLWKMLETVLKRRESRLFAQVRRDLRAAEREVARDAELSPAERKRMSAHIRNMRRLADVASATLQAFIRSRRLDLSPLTDILSRSLGRS